LRKAHTAISRRHEKWTECRIAKRIDNGFAKSTGSISGWRHTQVSGRVTVNPAGGLKAGIPYRVEYALAGL
jgi:hypothetical protein